MPVQPAGAKGVRGAVEGHPEYEDGLKDLEGFSHIMLFYHFHRSKGFTLRPIPFLDSVPRGVFSTRAPRRPNPVGFSVVRLRKVEGRILHIENVDMVDGTPLLDIKPYVPEFDRRTAIRAGWLGKAKGTVLRKRSDPRFR